MTGKPAAQTDRERFPDLAATIGEDPARFLDHDLIEHGDADEDVSLQRLTRARIRGLDRLDVARAWLAIERRLERGPRDPVVQLLEDRIETLEETGERDRFIRSPDRLRARAEELAAAVDKAPAVYCAPDGEETSRSRGTSASQKMAAMADGGDEQ